MTTRQLTLAVLFSVGIVAASHLLGGQATAEPNANDAYQARLLQERQVRVLEKINRNLDKLAGAQLDRELDATRRELAELQRAVQDNTRALGRR